MNRRIALQKAGRKTGVFGQLDIQLFVLPALLYVLIFNFYPMLGLQIAFRDYKFNQGIWGSQWVGLKHFQSFFTDINLWPVLRNTLVLSITKTIILFPLPIIFAILLNEMKAPRLKRTIQTVSYFPYFISWPIVTLLASYWLSSDGLINSLLMGLGILDKPYFFLGAPEAFHGVSITLDIWKTLGYSSIIYLAAIAAVDVEQLEAAVIDGANRFTRISRIILPALLPTISILMIMNIGSTLSGGLYASNFQISYNLTNRLNASTSEILDTYILKIGISQGRFSYATAIGLLNSIVSGLLLLLANYTSKRISGESFF